MFDVRIEASPKATICEGCGVFSDGDAWYRLVLAMLTTGQVQNLWFCLQCGLNIGTLLLRDRLLGKQ